MSHVIISYIPALLKHSCIVLFIFTNFCSHWCCFMKFFRFVFFFNFSLLFLLTLVCFKQISSALHISLNFPNFLCSYWCSLNKLHLLCTFFWYFFDTLGPLGWNCRERLLGTAFQKCLFLELTNPLLDRTNVSTKSKGKIKETYKAEEFHWNRTYVSAKGHKNEENHARML